MLVHDFKTILLASDLSKYLRMRPHVKLRVHSVFETSANLLVEDELITLAVYCRELMPMGCIVDTDKTEQWGLREGDYVFFEENSFLLPQGSKITLLGANLQDVTLIKRLNDSVGVDRNQLSLLRKKLMQEDSIGIAELVALLPESEQIDRELNIYSRYIKDDLFEFLDDIKNFDYEAALISAEHLIGFGPGLTPSCDDFLSGLILYLYYRNYDQNLLQDLVFLARDKTSILSYHMLKNAAVGKAYKSYLDLIKVLGGGEGDLLDVLIDRVLSYGASSGSDFLFGVYCAVMLHEEAAMKSGVTT